MNRKNISWKAWGKELEEEVIKENLKKSKSCSIYFLEKQGNYLSRKEIFHAHWETYLTSSEYWKNWRERINNLQTEKEVSFYKDRLRAFIEFIEKYTCKDINNYCGTPYEDLQQWDPLTTPQLLEKELKRLENISEEEFNKTDKWRKSGPVWKELSTEEMLNDPWFNEQINNIFGLESKKGKENVPVVSSEIEEKQEKKSTEKNSDNSENRKDKKNESDYQNWTKDQLISETNQLKVENEKLRNSQTLTDSEKQERLQKNQQELDKVQNILSSEDTQQQPTNNNFPTSLIIGGSVLTAIGLVSLLVIKNIKKNKK